MKLIEKIVFSSSVIFGLFVIGPEVKSPDLEKTLPILEDNLEALKDWIEDREAIILRARLLERLWTTTFGDFEVMELCEFSFSEEATL